MPVLSAAVALLENSYMVTVSDIAERTGLDQADVARSLDAMDPTYVDFRKTETGGDPTFWYVLKVTPEARRAVGQWPTAESLIDRLAQAFREAADREEDMGGSISSGRRPGCSPRPCVTLPFRRRPGSRGRPARRKTAREGRLLKGFTGSYRHYSRLFLLTGLAM